MASEYGRVMTNRATLVGLAVEGDLGLAEVDLGLAGAVGQRDEDLGGPAPPGGDGLLDDGQAAGVAVLVAEPLEDPAWRCAAASWGPSCRPRGSGG